MLRYTRLLPLALVATLAAAPASAEMRWGANAFGSWNTHGMGDWNDLIDATNASGPYDYGHIDRGFAFGGGPTMTLDDRWCLGAHYERVMPSNTHSDVTGIEVRTGANVFGASAGYWFPSTTPVRFGVDGSADFYMLSGEIADPSGDLKVEGSGIGFLFRGLASYAFSPMFSGDLSAGYRVADIRVDSINGQDPSGSGIESQDYSGLSLRGGVSMSFGR